ncbi:MAG: CoA-transferase subunit beta [Actinomycetota bacterium]|nr:CoA-transferase subunit beta [Actinomycetota bacterium]
MPESVANPAGYTADEMMTVTAARLLSDGQVCFVGIGLPSEAANLARLSHAPDVVLIYESGTIGTRPEFLPLSIGDGELAENADLVVGVPEVFSYWLQAGRIDVGFLSAAQIDRFGNLNTTVIGPYDRPSVRLPGAGGAPEIASGAREVCVMLRQTTRSFVSSVDFVTSVGFGRQGEGRAGQVGAGPSVVITDLAVLEPDPESHELTLMATHPGVEIDVVVAHTGWDLRVAEEIVTTEPPTAKELGILRELIARTKEAHSGS